MSTLSYNGVTLGPFLLTDDFKVTPIYDDSGVNILYWEYDIAVVSYLSPPLASQYGGTNGETAQAGFNRIISLLLTPRASQYYPGGQLGFTNDLTYTVNSVNLIPTLSSMGVSQGDAVDLKGGPFPKYCYITKVTDQTFMISYRIVTYRLRPSKSNLQTLSGVLSHRWQDRVVIDDKWLSTRTRTGKLIITQGKNVSLDGLRENLVTTSIDPGFLRVSGDYQVTEDGCTLVYTITDREAFLLPPPPAIKASGWYATSASMQNGAYRMAQGSVRLEGAKTTPKAQLIQTAAAVLRQKFITAGGQTTQYPLLSFGVREELWENVVEVTMSGRLPSKPTRMIGAAVNSPAEFGQVLGSIPAPPSPDPGSRGTANILLHACAFWDPYLAAQLDKTNNSVNNNLIVPGN